MYLAQHAQSHVDGRQQSPKRRSHFGVECRRGEAEHEQGSVLGQVHTLKTKRHRGCLDSAGVCVSSM